MAGARTRRMSRIAENAELGEIIAKLRGHTQDTDGWFAARRRDYDTDTNLWLTTPFSRNGRGDEPIAESNYRVIKADLERISAFGAGGVGEASHAWPGGTIDTLMVRADDPAALRAVRDWVGVLGEYGVADDVDLAREEFSQNHPGIFAAECYSDDPECGCGVIAREYFPAPDIYAEAGQLPEETVRDGWAWGRLIGTTEWLTIDDADTDEPVLADTPDQAVRPERVLPDPDGDDRWLPGAHQWRLAHVAEVAHPNAVGERKYAYWVVTAVGE